MTKRQKIPIPHSQYVDLANQAAKLATLVAAPQAQQRVMAEVVRRMRQISTPGLKVLVGDQKLAPEILEKFTALPIATVPIRGKISAPVVIAPVKIRSAADVGHLVREARKAKKMTQQKFADLAGVGRRFISELENGKDSLEFTKVVTVAEAAGIDLFVRER